MKQPQLCEKNRPGFMRSLSMCVLLATTCAGNLALATEYSDRFVWIFGWKLGADSDVAEISAVLDQAAKHGINGAVLSAGLDTLCKQSTDYFRRLDAVRHVCDRNHIELIPSLFSVGYGSTALAHDRNLAEGFPVANVPFVARKADARFLPDTSVGIANGGFEEFSGQRLQKFNLQDQPGQVSFVDREMAHTGKSSLRLENFKSNPHGHGRVMQEIRVDPHRCYRLSLWVKTEGLKPAKTFKVQVLAQNRPLAPASFNLLATTDWRKVVMLFNSCGFRSVRLYAGLWGSQEGKVWLDDWTVEEVGPLNVLHRAGTPVTVRNEDGSVTYQEGRDYAPLHEPEFGYSKVDRAPVALELVPGGRIRRGERLRVSWFHGMAINGSQVTLCMADPGLYEIYDHEAKLLAERVHPRRVLLSMDEIRMGGTCNACRGRNMGELLGECITKQTQILRRYNPGLEIYAWSDMLDPNHNAHGDYFLVEGDFTGSWRHVPKDLNIAAWGGPPREKSLRFFAESGFKTLVACYYDADNLDNVKGWLQSARQTPNARGFMYTPWRKKYELLPAFGDLLKGEAGP